MNRAVFFDAIRPSVGLTAENVPGFDRVIDYGAESGLGREALAYVIATAFWESGRTMRPVKEAYWLSEDWRKKNLRYYPWYGRGLVQTTWEDNYRAIAVAMGLPADTFIKKPDLLLEWEYALPALFVGMEKGLYTGKKLADYIDGIDESDAEDLREYANARRIVNGTDKQVEIGKIALAIEKGLTAAGFPQSGYGSGNEVKPPPPPDIEPPPADSEPPQSGFFNALTTLLKLILSIFKKG